MPGTRTDYRYQASMTYAHIRIITITPPAGETWPDLPGEYETIRPDRITVHVQDSSYKGRITRVSASGLRLKQDGTPGSLRVIVSWDDISQPPGWAAEITSRTLRYFKLHEDQPVLTGAERRYCGLED